MIDREDLFMWILLILAIAILFCGIFVGVNNSMKMSEYISDHKCMVTETKTETHLQPMMTGKVMTMVPVTSIRKNYHCKIDGKKGRNFWY